MLLFDKLVRLIRQVLNKGGKYQNLRDNAY